MHCSRCATEVKGKQLYCSNCGAEVISNRPKAPEQKDADKRYFDDIEKIIKTHQGNRFSDRVVRKSAKARMVLTAIFVPVAVIMLASTVCMFLVFLLTAPWDAEISKAKIFFFIPFTVSLIIVIIGLVRFYIPFLRRFRTIRLDELEVEGEANVINPSMRKGSSTEALLIQESLLPATPSAPRKYLYRRLYRPPIERRALSKDTAYSAFQVGSLSLMPIPFFSFPLAAMAIFLVLKSYLQEKRGEPVAEGAGKYRMRACIYLCLGLAINIYIVIEVIRIK